MDWKHYILMSLNPSQSATIGSLGYFTFNNMVVLFYNSSVNTKLTTREANFTNDDNYNVLIIIQL